MTGHSERRTGALAALMLTVSTMGCGPRLVTAPGVAGRSVADAAGSGHAPGEMVTVPRGKFGMGCRATDSIDCEDDALPVHKVRLPRFRIGRNEVTWDEYAGCVESGGCKAVDLARCYVWVEDEGFVLGAPLDARTVTANRPVVCVTWLQARQYCEWRDQRLPTEAEWERAARGDDDRQFPWGDQAPSCERANLHGCANGPRDVGSSNAGRSPYGLHDMAGNVWEWTHDWYDEGAYRRLGQRRRPGGPGWGEVKVVRGGSFYEEAHDLRASYRYGLSPDFGYGTVGLRCAR
ncbi:MAG: formylglycine-generating enzyme family protein [Deltaproteobacteria bacterium]|nr:formylglycine-generating enzyme family protein [Deltaproteobacteria bacterium]